MYFLVVQTTRADNTSQERGQIFRTVARAPSSDKTSTLQFCRIIGDQNSVDLRIECRSALNNECFSRKQKMLLPTATLWILLILTSSVS